MEISECQCWNSKKLFPSLLVNKLASLGCFSYSKEFDFKNFETEEYGVLLINELSQTVCVSVVLMQNSCHLFNANIFNSQAFLGPNFVSFLLKLQPFYKL